MRIIEYVPYPYEEVKISPKEYELVMLKNEITKENNIALFNKETRQHTKLVLSDSCNDVHVSIIETLFIEGSPLLRFFKNVHEVDELTGEKSDDKIVLVIEK